MYVSRFQAAIHSLRVNCAEIVQDRPKQHAYEMFGIKRRLQVRPPVFNESSERVHQIWVPRSKRAISATSTNLARERCPKNRVFSEFFFAILGCDAHLE